MAIRQLTDKEYQQLAEKALKAAKTPVPSPELGGPAADCKRVHRLLAVDGRKPEELAPHEQQFAAVFKGMKLATVDELHYGTPTGNLLPAIEVDE